MNMQSKKSTFIRKIKRQYNNIKLEIVESKNIPRFELFNLITIKNKESKCDNMSIFLFLHV